MLKDIPIIASAISIYKLGTSLRERHEILKLYHFVKALNNGMQDEQQREKYILNFQKDQKMHIAKLNGRLCGAKRPHSVSEQPNFYQSLQSNPYNDSSHPSGGE